MPEYYLAVAIHRQSYVIRHGERIYATVADCGHRHKTLATALRCGRKQVSKGEWECGEVRNSSGQPIYEGLVKGEGLRQFIAEKELYTVLAYNEFRELHPSLGLPSVAYIHQTYGRVWA
jgi:hypothetical protein